MIQQLFAIYKKITKSQILIRAISTQRKDRLKFSKLMRESFTFRANEDILKRQSKPQNKNETQHKAMPLLEYSVQRFDSDKIDNMNRLQLFEILYQVESINSKLKKQNGFEKTTTFYLQQVFQNIKDKSPQTIESSQKFEQNKSKQVEKQYVNLTEVINSCKQAKNQRQSDKTYQQTVQNLESQISQYQQNIQNLQPTVTQLEAYLSKIQTEIRQSQERLAQQQVTQKYLKNASTLNVEKEVSNQNSSDSDGQIDQIMDELYRKVKNIMITNAPHIS